MKISKKEKWIIMKSTRARKDFDVTERNAYSGPAVERAGVPSGKIYTDKKQATDDAKKLTRANPVGFTVVRLAATATSIERAGVAASETSLRKAIIRLAFAKPELRKDLVPVLRASYST